jgi:hypothetical protein
MKRVKKFGSRYGFKRFVEGGPTDYASSGSAGGSNVSFGEAFKAARKQGLETFTWRGKKYTTETKEDKAKKREADLEEKVEIKSKRPDFTEIYERDTVTDKTGAGQRGSSIRGGKRNPSVNQKIAESIKASTKNLKNPDSIFERLSRSADSRKAEAERKAKRINEAREAMGYRKGGKIDGIAKRGKTRGKMV